MTVALHFASSSGFEDGRRAVYNTLDEAILQGEADNAHNSDRRATHVTEWDGTRDGETLHRFDEVDPVQFVNAPQPGEAEARAAAALAEFRRGPAKGTGARLPRGFDWRDA